MTDPVALALIAAAVPVVATLGGNFILTWRAAIMASTAREIDKIWKDKVDAENAQSIRERSALQAQMARLEQLALHSRVVIEESRDASVKNSAALEVVHDAVNGGMRAAKDEISALKGEVARLQLMAEHGRLGAAAVVAARVVTDAAATAAGVLKSDAATASVLVTADAAIAGAALAATPAREPLDADDTDAGHRVRGTYR